MTKNLKIACLVKIVPDVNNFVYDYDKNILVRENTKSIINPADTCAVAAALKLKKRYGAQVTIISMGPQSVSGYLEDLIRRGADKAVLITDPLYRGSDTYATSLIIARCIERYGSDIIFTGTHSLDGDTAHVPCQVAELLDMNVMGNVVEVVEDQISDTHIRFKAKDDDQYLVFEMKLPAVLAVSSESKYKMPFVKYENIHKDVTDSIVILTNKELGFDDTQVGLAGSKTKVVKTYPRQCSAREKVVVSTDEQGIEYVYQFLKEKGFV